MSPEYKRGDQVRCSNEERVGTVSRIVEQNGYFYDVEYYGQRVVRRIPELTLRAADNGDGTRNS